MFTNFKTGIFVFFTIVSFGFTQDVIFEIDGSSLNYESTANISGFQFDHDGCAVGSNGGDAAANGFTVTASETTVLGFSFSGSSIPPGSGVLIDLGSDECGVGSLSGFVVSDPGGVALDSFLSGSDHGPDPGWTRC